jgi:GDP-L-fucose synthase
VTYLSESILVTGSTGMVGSNLVSHLKQLGYTGIYPSNSTDTDLRDQNQVKALILKSKPKVAVLVAAKVGGVLANSTKPGSFAVENLLIQTLILNELIKFGTKKIIFIGSSCVYPKNAPIPLEPSSLLTGQLEDSNKWYATAKLSMMLALDGASQEFGIQTVTLMPTNLYGPRDNFDINFGHLIPSLIRKCHEAAFNNRNTFSVWGNGNSMREVLFVDDMSRAISTILSNDSVSGPINVGSGDERSIIEIAKEVSKVVGFKGEIELDKSKPDGVFRKPLNSDPLINLGWQPQVDFKTGLEITYKWYLNELKSGNVRGAK